MRVAVVVCAFLVSCGSSSSKTPPSPPPAPPNLVVTTTDSSATLSWDASSGAISYDVLRAPGGTTNFAAVGTTTTNGIMDSGLTPNTPYVYEVSAANVAGKSAFSTVNATTAPVAPTGVSAVASNHHVALTWTAAPGAGSAGYHVLRSAASGGPFAVAGTANTTQFVDTFLANDTTYYYVVHTIGGSGESGDSNVASAKPFIEICALDGAANTISVYDGAANGNTAPKRSFGWQTGIAQATGIGFDGSNVYLASRYTKTVNVYPRTVSGNTAPSRTIVVPDQPTALTVDAVNSEIYVAMQGLSGFTVNVYPTSASGAATPARSLFVGSGGLGGVTSLAVDTTHNQLFVVISNQIVVYNRTDSGSNVTPQNTISPGTPVGATTILYGAAYDSFDDTVWVGWSDNSSGSYVGSVASYLRTASGTTAATRGPYSGTVIPQPRGIWIEGTATSSFVRVSSASPYPNHSGDVIYKLGRTTGSISSSIKGSATQLYEPGAMVADTANSEFWVVNGHDGAEAFSTSSVNNAAPARSLDGFSTGLVDPIALAPDRSNGELVELDFGPVQSINAYPQGARGGSVAPSRTISGPTTTLSGDNEYAIAIDQTRGQYWVNKAQPALIAFDRTLNGDGAPLQTIAGTNVDPYSPPFGLAFDEISATVVGGFQNAAHWDLAAWVHTDSGNVGPDRDGVLSVTNAQVSSLSFDLVHDLLYACDGTTISAFPRSFASGALTPTYSFQVPASQVAVDPEGDEVYVSQGNDLRVFPRSSTGSPSPTRTIQGSATKLYQVKSLAVCN